HPALFPLSEPKYSAILSAVNPDNPPILASAAASCTRKLHLSTFLFSAASIACHTPMRPSTGSSFSTNSGVAVISTYFIHVHAFSPWWGWWVALRARRAYASAAGRE